VDHGRELEQRCTGNGSDVCIGDITTGTYTVTLNTSTPNLGSLSVGGISGTQTLILTSGYTSLTLGSGTNVINANGVMDVDSTLEGATSSVTLTNNGNLTTGVGSPNLLVSITNTTTGVIDINDPTALGTTLTNNGGTIDVASTGTLTGAGIASVILENNGTVTNNGRPLSLQPSPIAQEDPRPEIRSL